MELPKRGRPPLDRDSKGTAPGVFVRVAASDLARAKAHADRERESVNDLIRRGLRKVLDDHKR